jgi:pimeloyl-ACP methyl ester carboxylesterase
MPPKFVEAAGLRFAYLEEGAGPLVLLLHGFPDTAHTWDRSMSALAAAGYRAVAPFMRGYAPTAIPAAPAYDSDTLGRDALALIAALAGPGERSAILVGHDWGASAAYSAATLGPERIRLLVTLAIPHPRSILPTPAMLWKVRHFAALRRKRAAEHVRADDFAGVDELWRRWSPAWTQIPPEETAPVKECFRQPGALDAALGYYRALTVRVPPAQRRSVTVPAVAFAGLHDGIVTPAAYERARRCYQAAYHVVRVPGGHFMHREQIGRAHV